MVRMLLLLSAVTLASACAMPATAVRTTDTRPGLTVTGAPPDAFLFVDGKNNGLAAAYPAEGQDRQAVVLRVEPGTHDVEIVDPTGRVIFKQRIFVQSETKTIVVH